MPEQENTNTQLPLEMQELVTALQNRKEADKKLKEAKDAAFAMLEQMSPAAAQLADDIDDHARVGLVMVERALQELGAGE
jgi:hypothetical protein